jgi:hypothetical protein
MMEAVHTSEVSVYFSETTQCYFPEGSNLHTCHYEYVKCHLDFIMFVLVS